MAEPSFDWHHPDYVAVFQQRLDRLARIRAEPSCLPVLRSYYRENPAQFITDWGCTYDPRLPERGLPATVPFVLFDKQREWVEWIVARWRGRQDGLTEKSRDMGISWLATALSATLCLHNDGLTIGFGSRTEDDVDRSGDPASLFWKARQFLSALPPEFRAGYDEKKTSSHLLLSFPDTGSTMTGDAGDNIGRGARTSMYFVDEAAYLPRPQLVDAALSQTTNCRQDVSTPRGMGNPFATKRFGGKVAVFTFHWRDDPRKDDDWYVRQCARLDPVTRAAEIDLDYSASVEGVLIPSAWVQSAVDAHIRLSITPSGARGGALDVADEGKDTNAFCGSHGILIETLEEWSGRGDDIFGTTVRAFTICDQHGYTGFKFDSDGLGAAVRGDARVVNEERAKQAGVKQIVVEPFRGSAGVFAPEKEDVPGRKNQDMFLNLKAQAWWALRQRFEETHLAVTAGVSADPDKLISIPSGLSNRAKLCTELSQPTYTITAVGKIAVDKTPPGTMSPNLADAVMIRFSSAVRPPMRISAESMAASMRRPMR